MEPFLQKIVGSNPELRKDISDLITKNFEERKVTQKIVRDLLDKYEITKTPEQIEIIKSVDKNVNDFFNELGLKPIEVPPDLVHPIDYDLNTTSMPEEAGWQPALQVITLGKKACKNKLVFAAMLQHEMIHAKGYNALQITEPSEDLPEHLDYYRTGMRLVTRDGKKTYLENIDEGLTELINMRLLPKLVSDPNLSNEFKNQKKLKEYLFIKTNTPPDFMKEVYHVEVNQLGMPIALEPHPYEEERKVIRLLINKIYEHNKSKFKERRDVENFLIKAKLSGHLLELANLIDSSFGKGTFRKIAESDKELFKLDDLIKVVKSL